MSDDYFKRLNKELNRRLFGEGSEPMPEVVDINGVTCAVYPNGLIYRASDGCLLEIVDGELMEAKGPLTFESLPDNLSSGDPVRPQDLGRFINREEVARIQVGRMDWPSNLDPVEAMDWPEEI